MARIVILGAGIGGVSAAFDARERLGGTHSITLIGDGDRFAFTPSNPWLGVGWRQPAQTTVALAEPLARRDIRLIAQPATRIDAEAGRVHCGDVGIEYDYLIVCTGPALAFDEIPGFGPDGHSQSVCTVAHAERAWDAYQRFLAEPGPIVIGAVQGASCFGPAYEFALIVDADLRRRKLRDQVPITFVTSEPYIGHLGLGGVGDSRGMLESVLRQRHIKWICNARVAALDAHGVHVVALDDHDQPLPEQVVPQRFSMLLPAFRGVPVVAAVEGLCNPRGFVLVDQHQRSPRWRNIFAAGVCVAIPPVETTPVLTGAPKTGFMIESMVTTIVENIRADLEGRPATARATWNAVCLADMGDSGIAFVALPQIPPRNVTWMREGKWVHLAKVGFEKYFLHKVRAGISEPYYERVVLKALGIERLKG